MTRVRKGFWAILLFLVLSAGTGCSAEVKEPAVAGGFYPAVTGELKAMVDRLVARVTPKKVDGELLAVVVPHAGYQYSGGVAAEVYARLKGSGVKTVILIGPSHHLSFSGAAVYAEGAFRSPLGTVPVNERVARRLVDEAAGISFKREPFGREHSLEVQLPFLQRVLPDAAIVPILVGNPTRESFAALTDRLTAFLRTEPDAMLIVSTDLSHYHDSRTAGQMDRAVIDAVERLSSGDLESLLAGGRGEACGGYPLLYALAVVRNLGGTNGALYRYADSGDLTGDKKQVVGYAAMGLYRTPLTPSERRELVALARKSLLSQVTGKPLPDYSPSTPRLRADGASFVTLNDKNGNLRGCIGNILPMMPLARSVIMNARSAASRDPRFLPVRTDEVDGLHLEVTVLSPLEPIGDIAAVKIGTHGLYLEKGGSSAVFLPQVPMEQGWDLQTYLEQLSIKAGLPKDGWKGARLSRFSAEIIRE